MKRFLFLFTLWSLLSPASASAEVYRGHIRNLVVAPGQAFTEVHCFGCSIRIEGKVESELISILGGAEIQGEVHGDVIIVGGGLRIGPKAVLGADVIVIGGPVELDPSAQVTGEIINKWWLYLPGQRQVFLSGASVFLTMTLGLALFGYALFGWQRADRMTEAFRRQPFLALLLGLILAALGVYGLDATEFLGDFEDTAVYFILMLGFLLALPGFAALSLWFGRILKQARVVAVAAGAVLWAFFMIVPVVGVFVFCLLFASCVGTSAISRFGFARQQLAQTQTRD
jgi:hypothetical protein